jgi:uncharacterized protein
MSREKPALGHLFSTRVEPHPQHPTARKTRGGDPAHALRLDSLRSLAAAAGATVLLVTLLAAAFAACSPAAQPYAEEIGTWRANKDRYMRSSDSPVPPPERARFPGLTYFPVSPEYRVPAALTLMPDNVVIEMSTSTGQRRQMRRVGTLKFTLKGQLLSLTAFVEMPQNDVRHLFVPFGDLTNGTETYQGGRFLDLDRTATGIYDLDFNRAYHPFCLFNPTYDCPVPPRENRLSIPVRAGEKLPPEGH